MILNALVERLKRQSKGDFKGRHYEASLILQAVSWYLRYPLSYRDIEEMFRERGSAVDHSTLNRWVLAYAPRACRKVFSGAVCDGIALCRALPGATRRGEQARKMPEHTTRVGALLRSRTAHKRTGKSLRQAHVRCQTGE